MTNDIKGGRLRVLKCNNCLDGYLIVKKKINSDAYFLGCTNYKQDGSGCNETISIQQFNTLFPQEANFKRTLEEVNNREALKYIGKDITSIDTTSAVIEAKKLKEEEKKELNKFSYYCELISKYCGKYEDKIYSVEKEEKLAFIKDGKQWYWFWIDKKEGTFNYRFAHKDEIQTAMLENIKIKEIFTIIDDLMSNHYLSSRQRNGNLEKRVKTVDEILDLEFKKTPLFKKLRYYRMEVAKLDKVPPYVIMHDSTLIDICKKMPKTKQDLLKCSGFGERKLEKYGASIIEIVVKHKE